MVPVSALILACVLLFDPVAIVRPLLPVTPFTIVNLVAGGIGVRASTFLLGTVFGMAPGVALVAVLAHMLWP
jgi:phospholipase D1/2